MKLLNIITLNIWGGYIEKHFLKFVKDNKEIDIFCFQEVHHRATSKISTDDKYPPLDIFDKIQNILSEHHGFFSPVREFKGYGLAIFVKKDISITSKGTSNVHLNPQYSGKGPLHSRDLQWIECKVNNMSFYVLNFHGLWNGKGKLDSNERILQSKQIAKVTKSFAHPFILCGDFNLRPDTQSIHILEQESRNLITEYNVTSTRTKFYTKDERYADYIFLHKDIVESDFRVMPDEVSDHSPLILSILI